MDPSKLLPPERKPPKAVKPLEYIRRGMGGTRKNMPPISPLMYIDITGGDLVRQLQEMDPANRKTGR